MVCGILVLLFYAFDNCYVVNNGGTTSKLPKIFEIKEACDKTVHLASAVYSIFRVRCAAQICTVSWRWSSLHVYAV